MEKNKSIFKRYFARCSKGDIVFDVINTILIFIVCCLLLYPFLYMVSVSLSEYDRVVDVLLLPKGLNFKAYVKIFQMRMVWRGYLNSFIYTVLGLFISMALTILTAYPLSKSWLPGRKILSVFVIITMYFGGGLIPTYLLVTSILGWTNKIWAIVIPGAINTYYMMIMRSYFVSSIPKEIEEAGKIDGASELKILFFIYLPLSIPILATLALYYLVIYWNNWFSASIYFSDENLYPIQLILRNSLSTNNIWVGDSSSGDISYKSMNYALTVAVVLPILVIYPFCQKFFIKGVMVGSLKG